MRLVFQNGRFVGYRCLLKPNTHNFRYDVERKRWEKLVIKTKPVIGYKESPYDVSVDEEVIIEPL